MMKLINQIGLANYFLYVLIFVHVCWLVVHIFLSSQGLINQWKLAGYGMYTGPSPQPTLEIFVQDGSLTPKKLTTPTNVTDTTDWYYYKHAHYDFSVYCLETSEEKINTLFEHNPELVGANLLLKATGRYMEKQPVRPTIKTINETTLTWIDTESYRYVASAPLCNNKQYEGVGRYIAS